MKEPEEIRKGVRRQFITMMAVCSAGTLVLCLCASYVMLRYVQPGSPDEVLRANRRVILLLYLIVFACVAVSFLGAYLYVMRSYTQAHAKLLEEEKQRRQLEVIKQRFFIAISHELKTPLSIIRGYAEGLKDHIVDDEAGRQEYAEIILDEATHMSRIVNMLKSIGEVESGAISISTEKTELMALIQNFLKSADILTKQKSAVVEFKEGAPCYVYADPFYTVEVLRNYYNNALQHVDERREIRICVEKNHTPGKVRVSVYNTGERIPDEALPQIWNMLYTTHEVRSHSNGGNGVGLAIVRAIQKNMNEAYGVYNETDGVTFYFELSSAEDDI
ncbi:MAG: hypothetical protein IJQ12_03645 [Lachnospiraceae bacterium]|nr:hypothetical protein [Lachnospiraceae bacterium]